MHFILATASRRTIAVGARQARPKLLAGAVETVAVHHNLGMYQQTAGVATATVPCLLARGSSKRCDGMRKSKKQLGIAGSTGRKSVADRIAELKRELAPERCPGLDTNTKADEVIRANAPTVKAGPGTAPYMSEGDFKAAVRLLWTEVNETANEEFNEITRHRIALDKIVMKNGGLSTNEIRMISLVALNTHKHCVSSGDRKVLEVALSYWREENFYEIFQDAVDEVDVEIRDIILQCIEKPPLEDFSPLVDRLVDLILDEIPPFRKREYHARKSELYFARRWAHSSWTTGKSMLPTLPEYLSPCIGIPIGDCHRMKSSDVQVGHVVTFVLLRPNGNTAFMAKRVRCLAGNVVEFDGQRVVVPEGHFWAVGDNEGNSFDSRHYGAIPLTNLRQRMLVSFQLTPPFVKWLSSSYTCNQSPPSNSDENSR